MRCYEYALNSIRISIVYHKTEANATNKSYKRKGGLLKYDKADKRDNLSTKDLRKHTEEMQDAFIQNMKISCVLNGLALIIAIVTIIIRLSR